jgi:hypothetical protein
MRVIDSEKAALLAKTLRTLADEVERGHVKAFFGTLVYSLEGAKHHGYVLEHVRQLVDTVGIGEYLLLLGALRDGFLENESWLMNLGNETVVESNLMKEGE